MGFAFRLSLCYITSRRLSCPGWVKLSECGECGKERYDCLPCINCGRMNCPTHRRFISARRWFCSDSHCTPAPSLSPVAETRRSRASFDSLEIQIAKCDCGTVFPDFEDPDGFTCSDCGRYYRITSLRQPKP